MTSITPVFTVKSVYRSVEWYQRLLGFYTVYLNEEPGEDDSLNYAVLRSGPVGLHLGKESDMNLIAGNGSCQISTERFNEVYRTATDEGAEVFLELSRNPVGERNFGIRALDKNQIVITEI